MDTTSDTKTKRILPLLTASRSRVMERAENEVLDYPYDVYLNGEFAFRSPAQGNGINDIDLWVPDEFLEVISELTLREIDLAVMKISFKAADFGNWATANVSVLRTVIDDEYWGEPLLRCTVTFSLLNWQELWTVQQFYDALGEIQEGVSSQFHFSANPTKPGTLYFHTRHNPESMLKEAAQMVSDFVLPLFSTVIARIDETVAASTVLRRFEFPEPICVACEQYLIYFAQFLNDIGIRATAEVTHSANQAGEVLFKVTPQGGGDALTKVRQALDIYL